MYIQIVLSLMVIVVISNSADDQAADDRTILRISLQFLLRFDGSVGSYVW